MIYYLWGGSFKGLAVEADSPREAVVRGVLSVESCVLHAAVRVSPVARGVDPLDCLFTFTTADDFQRAFPELVDHPEVVMQFAAVSAPDPATGR